MWIFLARSEVLDPVRRAATPDIQANNGDVLLHQTTRHPRKAEDGAPFDGKGSRILSAFVRSGALIKRFDISPGDGRGIDAEANADGKYGLPRHA